MSSHHKTTVVIVSLCLLCGALFLAQPALAAQGFRSGVQLCLSTVAPALFPFFVVVSLLTPEPSEEIKREFEEVQSGAAR